MGALAALAIGAAVLGTRLAPPPQPTPLTDVQREMLASGMFEADSFREPAFEALVENVRSWPEDASLDFAWELPDHVFQDFDQYTRDRPGGLITTTGTVKMIDPVGDAFPGVTRIAIQADSEALTSAMLVFVVDQPAPNLNDYVRVTGRAYKLMRLSSLRDDSITPFPSIVGVIEQRPPPIRVSGTLTGTAIITALTGALAVVLFVVVMGRHMLGTNRPHRSPLASTVESPDDASDA